MTIIERRNYTATGGNSATLPVLLPDLGVAGVTNRWVASMLGTNGSSVSEWEPYIGGIAMSQSSATLQPIVGTVSGKKVLRTDGVNDVIGTNGSTPAKTMTFLVRMLSAPGATLGAVAWDGGYFQRGSTGTASTVRTGAANLTQSADISDGNFHVVTIINDFAGGVGATVIDGLYGTQAADRENANMILGRGGTTSFSSVEFLEVATWSRALTPAECQTVRTNLQTQYPGLVA